MSFENCSFGLIFPFPTKPYPNCKFLLVISVYINMAIRKARDKNLEPISKSSSLVVATLGGRSQTTLTKLWLFLTTYPPPLTFCMVWTLTKSGHFWTTSSCKRSLWTTPYGVSLIYCNDWSGKNRLISIFGYSTRNRIICNLTPKWLWSFLWGTKIKVYSVYSDIQPATWSFAIQRQNGCEVFFRAYK